MNGTRAAYYDPAKPGGAGYWDYPTRSDTVPANTLIDPDPGNHATFNAGGLTIGAPLLPDGSWQPRELFQRLRYIRSGR